MGEEPLRIAVLPGDGIGAEVIGEVVPLIDALGRSAGPTFKVETLDWSAERFLTTGEALPANGFDYPRRFDVMVAENLLGDILPDLAVVLGGGFDLAPSANLHPDEVSLFEPVYGFTPELAGTGRANPMGALASLALLLNHLGRPRLTECQEGATDAALRDGCLTPALGGPNTTAEVGKAIRERTLERLGA